ncbi:MAG: Putative N-acetylmuramoyl-L-alanine amidase [Mitsuokella multacida]|jgi:N-acetylmuramoyl-L-alanine amidase
MKRVLFLVSVIAVMLLPMAGVSAADSDFSERVSGMAEITAVRVNSGADKIRIVVDASKPVRYTKMTLKNPDRVIVDIQGAWLSAKVKREISVDSRFVNDIRIGQFNKNTVRVVVENKVGSNNYKVFPLSGGPVPGRVVLDFGNLNDSSKTVIATPDVKPAATKPAASSSAAQPSQPAATKPAATKPASQTGTKPASTPTKPAVQPVKPTTPASTPSSKSEDIDEPAKDAAGTGNQTADSTSGDNGQKNASNNVGNDSAIISDDTDADIAALNGVKGKKITIDAGHGGNDSGAIGPTGVMEKTVTLRIANELRRLLVAEGATVYMTRTTDTEVSPKGANASDIEELQARCDVANNTKSDIFLSIHMDSFSSGAAKGTTGYYYSLGSKRSRDLADKVRQGVIDQIGTQSRGTQSCNFYVVKHTDMPATLVEVAFISNPQEEQLLNSEDGIKKAAQGIADGIADYFG